MRRVALLGLSANPPTDFSGHGALVVHLAESGECDEVWLLPVYVHIFSTKRVMERFEHRLHMCEILAERTSTERVRVLALDLERVVYEEECRKAVASTSPGRAAEVSVGTIDIIRYIQQHFKEVEISSINLGADSYNDLVKGRWKCYSDILREVQINVYLRAGFDNPAPAPLYAKDVKIYQLDSLGFTSSTDVRNSCPGVLADWPFSIPCFINRHKRTVAVLSEVYDYIRSAKIYFYSDVSVNRRLRWRSSFMVIACMMCLNLRSTLIEQSTGAGTMIGGA